MRSMGIVCIFEAAQSFKVGIEKGVIKALYQDMRAACYYNFQNHLKSTACRDMIEVRASTCTGYSARQYCWPHGIYHAHSCRSIEPYAPHDGR